MKGIYLAAFKALHNDYDIKYQDINGKRDIGGEKNRQGGSNVHNVIEYWLKVINCYF